LIDAKVSEKHAVSTSFSLKGPEDEDIMLL
jgi:hypothetical protein